MEHARQTSRRSRQPRYQSQEDSLHSRHVEHSRRLPPLATDHNDNRLLKLLNNQRQVPEDARYEWLMGKLRRKLQSSLSEQGGWNLPEFEQYLKKLNSFMEEDGQENQPPLLRPIGCFKDKTDRRVRLRPLIRRN